MSEESVIKRLSEIFLVPEAGAKKFLDKSKASGEISHQISPEQWLEQRIIPNTVYVNQNEYAQMCIDALKIVPNMASTNFGTAQQRDLGQSWADTTRGYIGELACQKFLAERYETIVELDHAAGDRDKYIEKDIHQVFDRIKKVNREPNLSVGIKSAKTNAMWLDIPSFSSAEAHVFVQLEIGLSHLFAFFKGLSVFKDKVLKKGVDEKFLTEEESQTIWDTLPNLTDIPAYITGFVWRDIQYKRLSYTGKMGIKHYKINSWCGPFEKSNLTEIKQLENVPGDVNFLGIENFSKASRHLFNTGSLLWKKDDWDQLVSKL